MNTYNSSRIKYSTHYHEIYQLNKTHTRRFKQYPRYSNSFDRIVHMYVHMYIQIF